MNNLMEYVRLDLDTLTQIAFDVNTAEDVAEDCQKMLYHLQSTTQSIEVLRDQCSHCVYLYEDGYIYYSEIGPAKRFHSYTITRV